MNAQQKSIGNEKTFAETLSIKELDQIIMELSKMVCMRMQKHNVEATRIRIKMRFADWSDIIHVEDLPEKSNELSVIYQSATKIMQRMFKSK